MECARKAGLCQLRSYQQPQNILLDAVIVGDHAITAFILFAARRGYDAAGAVSAAFTVYPAATHRGIASRSRSNAGDWRCELNRSARPIIFVRHGDAARKFLPGHGGKRASLGNQLFGCRAISRKYAAESANIAKMPHQRASIDIPNDGDAVAFEILLCGFARAPIGSQGRKFPYDQPLDPGLCGFLVVQVRADVSYMGISETDDLPGVARIGENFLVAGEAGVENDFTATARASARRASVKNSSVLERERRASSEGLVQCVLQEMERMSFRCGADRRSRSQRTEVVRRPVSEYSLAIDELPRHRTENARVVRTVAMIAHYEVIVRRNAVRCVC